MHPSKSYRKGICTKQTYAILALKSVFGRIGDVFMIYLEFREKLSHFFKNSCDLIYALNLYVTVFFSTQLYPKTNKNYEQL